MCSKDHFNTPLMRSFTPVTLVQVNNTPCNIIYIIQLVSFVLLSDNIYILGKTRLVLRVILLIHFYSNIVKNIYATKEGSNARLKPIEYS